MFSLDGGLPLRHPLRLPLHHPVPDHLPGLDLAPDQGGIAAGVDQDPALAPADILAALEGDILAEGQETAESIPGQGHQTVIDIMGEGADLEVVHGHLTDMDEVERPVGVFKAVVKVVCLGVLLQIVKEELEGQYLQQWESG